MSDIGKNKKIPMQGKFFFGHLWMGAILLLCGGITVWFARRNPLFLLGGMQVLLGLTLLVGGTILYARWRRQWMEALESFSFCTEAATRASVLNFPAPMVVTDRKGNIRWYNHRFREMVGDDHLFGERVYELFTELPFGRFVEDGDPEPEEYSFRGRDYLVTGQLVSVDWEDAEDDSEMVGIYFVDLTRENQLKKMLADRNSVVCSVVIDNYEEVLKSTPNAAHGTLGGEIEGCINAWVEEGAGVSVHYERDKFLILFEAANFAPLWKDKFKVLDQVKEIDCGNRIPVTVSIGVGQSKTTLRENEALSNAALEMALGRGGDQAVVRTASGFQFYGAKSREIEKNTRVKARVVAHCLQDLAEKASGAIIMGHHFADADCLGAAVGIFCILKAKGIDAYIAMDRYNTNCRPILDQLLSHEEYERAIICEERALDLLDDKSLLVVVDTHRPGIVEFPSVLAAAKNVVLVDHHRRGEEFIENTVLSYHEPYVSSSCEMVTEILRFTEGNITPEPYEAEALYSGIYMDTKGFTFKTGAHTFEAASYLRKCGVDPVNMRRLFCSDMDFYIQKSKIISRAQIYRDHIAIALCTEKCANPQLVVAQAADDLLNIEEIEASFVLAADGNRVIISGRSLGSINVQVILEKLGGGGHITIAGAQLAGSNPELAMLQLREAIDEVVFE